ncbi:3-phenylpropionate/trans-cinnamate dioxygenase ferredoxin reductase subunit [Scopulibacillus darangshiensis]|uniref:3-phenylpropionate/trans-cinnamate dioxygenase ferredoxin reductase subunit n=1 Tax=Scopulibacillus darangshiensis TaxID=442528 RepID=A0A4R2NMZ0_9BACL|nr:FAD-dependent oxidoreductase [Scopulibacillus darangshiensis]TCP22675.1 3-phenylpropionate/trans-cinnamate dioxygenase ferredoxin reductase subunit [Scopulibacillus darangshiensis]
MTTIDKPIMIIGAGIAGVHAAETLRNEGYEGRIVLVDRDTQLPYDRPPLSKEFMLGESSETDISLRSVESLTALRIELKLGVRIVSIDAEKQIAISSDGEIMEWGKLLLTTGSSLRKLQVNGSDLEGIHYLKTLSDAIAIRQKLDGIQQIVIVGAGFIGAELASSFKRLGKEVTVLEHAPLPLARILGDEMGDYFLQLHQSEGVHVITEDSVVQFDGTNQVEKALTKKGRVIPCQAVIVGIGVIPNTFLSDKGLHVDRGYIVNEFGETSLPNVYAAGDCAMWPFRGTNIHIEHWDHAVNHGKCVAKNMLGGDSNAYTTIPYFWSDQYDHRLQYFGHTKNWEATVLRGNMVDKQFTHFYLNASGVVEAALLVNQPKNALAVRRLIKQQQPVDPDLLSNPEVNLKKVHIQAKEDKVSN